MPSHFPGLDPDTDLDNREQLLLMAAYFHGAQPRKEIRANGRRVLRQALLWAGLWNGQLEHDEHHDIDNPVLQDWYQTLIAMTRRKPKSKLLLEGAGNFGSPVDAPACPRYTGCRLTRRGREFAEKLREQYPQYRL